jgi:hypothetical protein
LVWEGTSTEPTKRSPGDRTGTVEVERRGAESQVGPRSPLLGCGARNGDI